MNQRFARPCRSSPTQHKEVKFTIPDLAWSKITTNRKLKGPQSLRVVRTVAQNPRDPLPIVIHHYTLMRRGEWVSPSNPSLTYYQACLNNYEAIVTYF